MGPVPERFTIGLPVKLHLGQRIGHSWSGTVP